MYSHTATKISPARVKRICAVQLHCEKAKAQEFQQQQKYRFYHLGSCGPVFYTKPPSRAIFENKIKNVGILD